MLKSTSRPHQYPNCQVWKLPDGPIHREVGPAVIWQEDGHQQWFVNGRMHRWDGPANLYPDGRGEWHVNGKYIDNLIREWAVELGIDLNNLTEDDKVLIQIKWIDYNGK